MSNHSKNSLRLSQQGVRVVEALGVTSVALLLGVGGVAAQNAHKTAAAIERDVNHPDQLRPDQYQTFTPPSGETATETAERYAQDGTLQEQELVNSVYKQEQAGATTVKIPDDLANMSVPIVPPEHP